VLSLVEAEAKDKEKIKNIKETIMYQKSPSGGFRGFRKG
jgi:hypothetical protein